MQSDCESVLRQICAKKTNHVGIASWYVDSSFAKIYVRLIENEMVREKPTIIISSIDVFEPRKGYFKCLIEALRKTDYVIEIENVLNDDFARHLLSIGFIRYNPLSFDRCYRDCLPKNASL